MGASETPDAAELSSLHRRAFEGGAPRFWTVEEFDRILRDESVSVIHQRNSSTTELIGFIAVICVFDEAEILTLAVEPKHWGQKIARNLLVSVEMQLRSRGVTSIVLEVAENNMRAQNLYQNSGFERFGIRRKYYRINGNTLDAITMRRILE